MPLDISWRRIHRRPAAPEDLSSIPAASLAEPGPFVVSDATGTRPPWPVRMVDVAGTRLAIRHAPATSRSAQPALFVHGLGGASTNFTDVMGLLSPWLDSEAIDLPGFGYSGAPPSADYSLAGHIASVISYLERSGRGPVHLVGNSMGGTVSIMVAARRPDLVRTLTLISPAVPDLRVRRSADLVMPLMTLPVLGRRMLRTVDTWTAQRRAESIIELCFAHPDRVPANRLAEAVADIRARRADPWAHDAFLGSLRALVGSYLAVGSRGTWQSLARITAPSLVIWGAVDRLVDVSNAPRVAARLSDAQLLVLTDVGHTAQLEDPVMTARAIAALVTVFDRPRDWPRDRPLDRPSPEPGVGT